MNESAFTIISGGQTGADRAALDVALALGIPHGGWCPRGRLAEDGPIEAQYQLQETQSRRYEVRTKRNVRESDATVLFTIAATVAGGTALTQALAERIGRPCLHLSRDSSEMPAAELQDFVARHHVRRLNVAGPRASQVPEIGEFVTQVLTEALGPLRR